MGEDEVRQEPGSPGDALRLLAATGRGFHDYAALFAPGAGGWGAVCDPALARGLAAESLRAMTLLIEAAGFDPESWRIDESLAPAIPGFIGLAGAVGAIRGRWFPPSGPPGGEPGVEPAELDAIRRGLDAIDRWESRQPVSPPGWRVMFDDLAGKVVRFRDPLPHVRVRRLADPPKVVLDGDTSIEVTPAIADYFLALLDAGGDPLPDGDIRDDSRYPALPKNLSRLRDEIRRLSPALGNLIEHVEGHRIRGWGDVSRNTESVF